jgi:hypothetical protein
MKIVYAAGNRGSSYFQMVRFLQSVAYQNHTIKLAAYKNSMGNLPVDYTLDSLLNFSESSQTISFNGNYNYLFNEIKRFGPDLIISDFEVFSSVIAIELSVNLWQFSSSLLYYGLKNEVKYNLGIHRDCGYLINNDKKTSSYIQHILKNSTRKFIVSHICDTSTKDIINDTFEWVRPNFITGDGNEKTDILAISTKPYQKIISLLTSKSVMFSQPPFYDASNENRYKEYLNKCKCVASDGTPVFLSDAFYNQKYCFSYPHSNNIESITGSYLKDRKSVV